jgi:hypothetical protein
MNMKNTLMLSAIAGFMLNSAYAQTKPPKPVSAEQVIQANNDLTNDLITQIKRELEKDTKSEALQAADYYRFVQPRLKGAFEKAFQEFQAQMDAQVVPPLAAYLKRYQSVFVNTVISPQQKQVLLQALLNEKPALETKLSATYRKLLLQLYSTEDRVIEAKVEYDHNNCFHIPTIFKDALTGQEVKRFVDYVSSDGDGWTMELPQKDPLIHRFFPNKKWGDLTVDYVDGLTYQSLFTDCYSRACLALNAGFKLQFLDGIRSVIDHDLEYKLADGENKVLIYGNSEQKWLMRRIEVLSSGAYPQEAAELLPFDVTEAELPQAMENQRKNAKAEVVAIQAIIDAEAAKVAAQKKADDEYRAQQLKSEREAKVAGLGRSLYEPLEMDRCPDDVINVVKRIKEIYPLTPEEKNALTSKALEIHLQYTGGSDKDRRKETRQFNRSMNRFDRASCLN